MQRLNWMTVATWAVPFVCLVISFFLGYYFYTHLVKAEQAREDVNRSLVAEQQELKRLNQETSTSTSLTVPKTSSEQVIFTQELNTLCLASGAKIMSNAPTTATVLPDILSATKPAGSTTPSAGNSSQTASTTGSSSSAQTAPSYSLKNLPAGATALSNRLMVTGHFLNVRDFLYRLKNYRYQRRALNLNEVRISNGGNGQDKSAITADILLTRFVGLPPPAPTPTTSGGGGSAAAPAGSS